jgi:hypothetical protein
MIADNASRSRVKQAQAQMVRVCKPSIDRMIACHDDSVPVCGNAIASGWSIRFQQTGGREKACHTAVLIIYYELEVLQTNDI